MRIGPTTALFGGHWAADTQHECFYAFALMLAHLLEFSGLVLSEVFGDFAVHALENRIRLLDGEFAQLVKILTCLCDGGFDLLSLLFSQIKVFLNGSQVSAPELLDRIPVRVLLGFIRPGPMDTQGSSGDSASHEDASKNEKDFPGEVHFHDWLMISETRS
jgi:hypothetical protein